MNDGLELNVIEKCPDMRRRWGASQRPSLVPFHKMAPSAPAAGCPFPRESHMVPSEGTAQGDPHGLRVFTASGAERRRESGAWTSRVLARPLAAVAFLIAPALCAPGKT